jgi:signal transduction histidine kinase
MGRMLRIIRENTQRALMIIDELRANTREIILNRVDTDLASLIKKFIDETTFPEGIKVETRVEKGLRISIDPGLIRRVIENLVSNAVDAMPQGGVLTIRANEGNGSVNVEVEDTGMGIPEEAIPKIFDPLYTTKAFGLGFGLAFSKRVVDAHGGTIAFRTVIGSGTTFTVKIPHS